MTNLHCSLPIAPAILSRVPPEVSEFVLAVLAENQALREKNRLLGQEIVSLRKRLEELETKLNRNSSNSNKPPSSDSPFSPKPRPRLKSKKTGKRKGSRQQCLRPTELKELHPEKCSCGCHKIERQEPYCIHQVIELPEIKATVSHVVLYRGRRRACGKTVKAYIPREERSGFGPRFCAMVAELAAVHGNSRRGVQDFLASVIGVPVSQGADSKYSRPRQPGDCPTLRCHWRKRMFGAGESRR